MFRILRWSVFAAAVPICFVLSFFGWIATGFAELLDALTLLLAFPTLLLAIRSIRVCAVVLGSLLLLHLSLPLLHSGHFTIRGLVSSQIDLWYLAAVACVGIASIIPDRHA